MRSFLVEGGFIDTLIAELSLCRLCIRYLNFPCFAAESHRKETNQLIKQGYYIFAAYATVYWTDHLTNVVAFEQSISSSDKDQLLQDIQHLLANQFNSCYPKIKLLTDKIKQEFSIWNKEACFEQLVEAITVHRLRRRSDQELLKAHKDFPLVRSNMRMEENFIQIRRTIYHVKDLDGKYGKDLFHCSRLDCQRFSNGFSDPSLYHDHEEKHESIKCPIEGCIAIFRGRDMNRRMDRHLAIAHDPDHDKFYPIGRPQDWTNEVKELIRYVDIHGLEEALSKPKASEDGTKQPYRLFEPPESRLYRPSDGLAKEAWRLVVANPIEELLQVLIKYTCFKDSYAQDWILQQAALAGNQDLVDRFIDIRYDNKRKDRAHPAWDRAMKTAIKSGHSEILDLILQRAMLNSRERPSEEKIRDLCIVAAEVGHLPCVELLVSKYNADPYHARRGVNIVEELGLSLADRLRKDRLRKDSHKHSVFYHAVLHGHIMLLRHLIERATGEQLTTLFQTEPREDLILLAAANGFEDVISTLNTSSIERTFIDNAQLRARFYNAIRKGSTEAEKMLDQAATMRELIDRDGCTPLMHAAVHGLKTVAHTLVEGGADVLRKTVQYGDRKLDGAKCAEDLAMENGHSTLVEILRLYKRIKKIELEYRMERELKKRIEGELKKRKGEITGEPRNKSTKVRKLSL